MACADEEAEADEDEEAVAEDRLEAAAAAAGSTFSSLSPLCKQRTKPSVSKTVHIAKQLEPEALLLRCSHECNSRARGNGKPASKQDLQPHSDRAGLKACRSIASEHPAQKTNQQ